MAAAGTDAVSMETVAERAGVSRTLLYKHFANRMELLTAVYRREANRLHVQLAAEVHAAETLEGMYRALLRAAFRATAERSALFLALRAAGVWDRELRREQRDRDRGTVAFFAEHAVREFGLALPQAEAATAMLLAAIDSILAAWRLRPTSHHEDFLEETYLELVLGGLTRLGRRQSTPTP